MAQWWRPAKHMRPWAQSLIPLFFFFFLRKKSLAGTNIIWVNTRHFLGQPRINQLFGMLNTVF